MDWANIERDVALRTESRNLRNIDFDSSTRSGKVTKLIDGILSSKLLLEDKPMKENQSSNYNESASHHFNPMLKTLMADLAELQSALRFQSSRIEQFDTSYTRYDHDVLQMKKNQDALFDRINHIEAGTQGKSTDVDVLELYNDVQLRLKRVESNVNGLEENSRVYNVQFATKDAFAKLLDTIFDQLKSLTATVELSRDQCTHASVLFDALASAFVMLNGDDSLHQLELVTSFSREINKDHLARILTDALIRSVDGSIQAHLKPAMSLMHSSLLELIDELRAKQDAAIQSMRGSFQQLARQVQEDRAASFLLPPQPTTQEVKLDEGFLADFKQMKEKMEALSEDNKSLRQSLESQSAILAGLVTSQETAKTLDAEALLKVKTQCETLEHDVFALKEEGKNVRVVAAAAQSLAEETSAQLQDTEERITVLNSEVHGKVEAVEGALSSRLEELDQIVATKADAGEVEALRVESKQHAAKIKTLEAAAATVVDLEALQGKVDVVSSDLNILQGDLSTMEKKHQGRLRVHDEDVVELRKLANENSDATGKLSKRFDLSESTAQSKLSNLSTELHHKIADSSEAVTRLSRRFDLLDADAQAKNVSLRETQSKVQSHAEVLSDLTRKLTLLDSSCSAQFSSVVSQQKSTQEEVVDFTAKVTRKLDLHEAEILSKFTIRNDRVDALLMQNQESISKLGDRIDLTEHKQLSAMEELSSELRGKVSGAVDLTAQLNRRLETYQTDLSGRLSATQTDMSTLNKATNDRINAVIKQSDANIDLLQTQFTSKHNDLAHRLASMGDSMGNLAQQQFDLSNLQEKQQIDFNSLSAELGSMRVKLEEKLSSAVGTLQNSLASHSKAHQSALAEEKYDLLQLTSRVALLEQLVRYGQDLEDQTIAAGASGFGSSQTQAGSPRAMAPRPADPDTRAKLVELKGLVDGVCADNASQRAEFEARLDAFKVGLAALRKQYEDEVEEIKEISQAQQRTVTRCVGIYSPRLPCSCC
jgi:chromosome segregation ATPase